MTSDLTSPEPEQPEQPEQPGQPSAPPAVPPPKAGAVCECAVICGVGAALAKLLSKVSDSATPDAVIKRRLRKLSVFRFMFGYPF